jgi:dissimilatory sulfite reductase (desulfoviridin) alpha/beta subunit
MTHKAHRIKVCWGIESGECPNLIFSEPELQQDLKSVIEGSGWPELLAGSLPRKIKPLDQFSVSVSGCPNGCSRPQIADLGLLQAKKPAVAGDLCTGCGECLQACREGAIDLQSGQARIDPERCLACGHCLQGCPEGALWPDSQGYRLQVGGKLGRHPRLADELPGIQARWRMLDILERCLRLHIDNYRPGLRFGQVVAEQGAGQVQQSASLEDENGRRSISHG